jgi:putative transposase
MSLKRYLRTKPLPPASAPEELMSKYQDRHIYHVYNRGAHESTIFRRPYLYRKCVGLLRKYAEKYHVTLVAYCLMPNHYHLVVRQEADGSISRFLQTTFNAFVQYFNVLEEHSGTLFQGPAKSTSINTEEYLLQVIRYVHLNPVKAKMVKTVAVWEFSDCSEWVNDARDFPGKSIRDLWFKDGLEYLKSLEGEEAEGPLVDEP